jgi:hypothetical protein
MDIEMMIAAGALKADGVHILVYRCGRTAGGAYAFFFTSLTLEKTMPSARSRV